MILGKSCTRSCAFCSVTKGVGEAVDIDEPNHISECVKRLGLKYIIITSVTRDDLEDGGAEQFVRTIESIKRVSKEAVIELLIPDFAGRRESLEVVVASGADIIGHNIETVKRLYPAVKNGAGYSRSMDVLRFIKESNPNQITKSALLVGMGETGEEVVKTMQDLRMAGCDILTIGQYLSPSKYHYQVQKFVTPDEFAKYKRIGQKFGFRHVRSGPFVRSSYFAEEDFRKMEEDIYGKCYAAAIG